MATRSLRRTQSWRQPQQSSGPLGYPQMALGWAEAARNMGFFGTTTFGEAVQAFSGAKALPVRPEEFFLKLTRLNRKQLAAVQCNWALAADLGA